ncbi:MAG: hypothetical protein RQ729_03805 [Wenzhouxiangellaceae bacterium]|nr:hypothetical protein [Wenzhouxiangellaceae bacterium]
MRVLESPIEAALDRVIEREAQVRLLPLDGPVAVDLSAGARHIAIRAGGMVVEDRLDLRLIHQFGSRIWPNLDRDATIERWKQAEPEWLAQRLAAALENSDAVLRYQTDGRHQAIYGLTATSFVEMNQQAFRNELIAAMKPIGIRPNGRVFETAFQEVVEEFGVPSGKGAVGLHCRVIYGLNTGYSAYRLRWGRTILVCSNGLTSFENVARDRWIHTRQVAVGDFVNGSVQGAYSHLSDLEKQIHAARNRSAAYALIDQFLTRLTLARATQQRVVERVESELSEWGRNEWSVSQALTYLGTHEKAIPPRVRDHLTRVGTDILDEGLAVVAASPHLNRIASSYD